MRVASVLGIPLHTFDFEREYRARVHAYLVEEYRAGRTPNPDVLCNSEIKFDLLLKATHDLDCAEMATGHYARVRRDGSLTRLLKGVDPKHITQICVKLEAELVSLSETEIREYLDTLGVNHTGLEQLILAGYQVLDLITFLTTGEKETRAWTVKRGSTAPQAAGKIHSDFEKGFIVADTVNWKALLDAGGWTHAREQGLIRNEGKSYIVQDGDVMIFRFDKK